MTTSHNACGSLLVSRNHVLRADRTDPKTDFVWQLWGHESTSSTKPSEDPTGSGKISNSFLRAAELIAVD